MPKFDRGDTVRITAYGDISHLSVDRQARVKEFVGLLCTVRGNEYNGMGYDTLLVTTTSRPDRGYGPFYWSSDKLELVLTQADELTKLREQVKQIQQTLEAHKTEQAFGSGAALREIARIVEVD